MPMPACLLPRPLPWALLFGLAPVLAAGPAPSIGELIRACERGLAPGGRGIDAALCEWYAVPCDCQFKRAGAPAVCVPPGTPSEEAARRVLAQLRREPDPQAPAPPAVERALARLYPCPAEGP